LNSFATDEDAFNRLVEHAQHIGLFLWAA